MNQLDFEKPVLELEGKIAELRHMSSDEDGMNIAEEIERMTSKANKLLQSTYSKLSAAQKVQVARHQDRPHFCDYIDALIEDFTPLAGDRNFAEDHALIGGLGRFDGRSVMVIGQEKGHDTQSRIKHNFGMTRPEGYRKAQRLIAMAEHFQLPIITLVDTAGAYPGRGAEERGQSEAIAKSIESCLRARVPIISIVIGEGGSGGAIAIAAANKVYMLEHSVYSVISPEGCASILWRSAEHAQDAAAALKLTAQDLLGFKLIDGIIDEPVGGAHRFRKETIANVGQTIKEALETYNEWDKDEIVQQRRAKFLAYGRDL